MAPHSGNDSVTNLSHIAGSTEFDILLPLVAWMASEAQAPSAAVYLRCVGPESHGKTL
jgi:hypothetical protein